MSNQNLQQINTNYQSLNDIYNNYAFDYGEITQNVAVNYIPNLVDIGTLCNDENSFKTFNFTQKWQTPDTINMCLKNAEKIVNDIVWEDETKIRNNGFTIKDGLNYIKIGASNYINDNTNFFINNESISTLTNASMIVNSGDAIEIFGYFIPDITGLWKFTIPNSSSTNSIFSKLWVSNNNALYDYTNNNADINNNISKNGSENTFSINLTRGDVVPIRLHFITLKMGLPNISLLTLTKPDGSIIIPTSKVAESGKSEPYFCTILNNGKIYLKKTLYIALTLQDYNKQLYNCFFLDPIDQTNKESLLLLKNNPKLQYVKSEISVSITYSGNGTYNQSNGSDTNIQLPIGVPLKINSATYGSARNYDYITSTPVTKESQIEIGPSVENKSDSNSNLTKYTTGYQAKVQITTNENQNNSVSQIKDVTDKTRTIVNGGENLIISGEKYDQNFGNPIKDGTTNPQLNINYSYNGSIATNITNKQIYIDPNNGKLTIGYNYQGNPNSSVIEMDEPNKNVNGPYNYRIILANDATLQVQDTNGSVIGKKNLSKYVDERFNFKLENCLVNPKWVNNPLNKNTIEMGKKFPKDVNELVSSDGRFKLMFFNGKIFFEYSTIPYEINNNGVKYTTSLNVDNERQIYYLYRIMSRGLHGKKFLSVSNNLSSTGYYIPNTYNNILKQNDYSKPISTYAYPLYDETKYRKYENLNDENDCKAKCNSDEKCEHYFSTTNTIGKTCYTDIVNNSNPLYFTQLPSNVKTSTLNKKKYQINSSCGSSPNNLNLINAIDDIDLKENNPSIYSNLSINYLPGENSKNFTYYCALPEYRSIDNNIRDTIENTQTSGTSGTSGTFKEGYTNSDIQPLSDKITDIKEKVKTFYTLQDDINSEYNKKKQLLNDYNNLSNKLTDQRYKFNGPDSIIPDLYVNNKDEKTPKITLDDGIKRDTQTLLLYQNRMFTLASISAVTFLILAVFLAKD